MSLRLYPCKDLNNIKIKLKPIFKKLAENVFC